MKTPQQIEDDLHLNNCLQHSQYCHEKAFQLLQSFKTGEKFPINEFEQLLATASRASDEAKNICQKDMEDM